MSNAISKKLGLPTIAPPKIGLIVIFFNIISYRCLSLSILHVEEESEKLKKILHFSII